MSSAKHSKIARGGKKPVSAETEIGVDVPLFIEERDIIRVNTKTGEYVERVKKGQ